MFRHQDFVQHHQVVFPACQGLPGLFIACPGAGGVPLAVGAGKLRAAAVLLHRHRAAQKVPQRPDLTGVALFHELAEIDLHARAGGPEHKAQRGGGLSLAVAGVYLHLSHRKLAHSFLLFGAGAPLLFLYYNRNCALRQACFR